IILDFGGSPIQNLDCGIAKSAEFDNMPGPFRETRIEVIPIDTMLSGSNLRHHERRFRGIHED
ncbi:MAG: hypothetical protein DME18_14750, partial [Verrucomicrobia bacterium]